MDILQIVFVVVFGFLMLGVLSHTVGITLKTSPPGLVQWIAIYLVTFVSLSSITALYRWAFLP